MPTPSIEKFKAALTDRNAICITNSHHVIIFSHTTIDQYLTWWTVTLIPTRNVTVWMRIMETTFQYHMVDEVGVQAYSNVTTLYNLDENKDDISFIITELENLVGDVLQEDWYLMLNYEKT